MKTSIKKIAALLGILTLILNPVVPSALSAAEPSADLRLLDEILKPEFAVIEDRFTAGASESGNPVLVLIQDAHSVPDAQESMRKSLHALHEKLGKDLLVAVEGAEGELHPEYFNFFPDYPAANEAIVKDLLAKGELSGAELFARDLYLAGEFDKKRIQGIEEAELYRDNGVVYDQVMAESDAIQRLYGAIEESMRKGESSVLNPELAKFVREVQKRSIGIYGSWKTSAPVKGETQYQAYADYIADAARRHLDIDLSNSAEQIRFPNAVRFQAIKKLMGPKISSRQVKLEWGDFQVEAGEQLKPEMISFISNGLNKGFDPSGQSLRSFLVNLHGAQPEVYEKLKTHQVLFQMLSGQALQMETDSSKLFEELEDLEYQIARKLAQDVDENLFLMIRRDWLKLYKLLNLELTSDQWEDIRTRLDSITPENILFRLKALGVSSTRTELYENFPAFDAATAFYGLAELRDEALIKNALTLSKERKARYAVVVSGGFHAEAFKDRLRKEQISFASVRPVIHRLPNSNLYRQAMTRQNSHVLPNSDLNFESEQTALVLKGMAEVGIPFIAKTEDKNDEQLQEILEKAIAAYPGFQQGNLSLVAAEGRKSDALVLAAPGIRVAARVKTLFSQFPATYSRLQGRGDLTPAPVNFELPFSVREGKVAFSPAAATRNENRLLRGYRQHGGRFTAEELGAHLHLEAERPSLERIRQAIKQRLGGKVKLPDDEFKKAVAQINEPYLIGIEPPPPGRLTIWSSVASAFKKAANLNPKRKAAVDNFTSIATVLDQNEEDEDLKTGAQRIREGQVEVVTLAGGLSLRGAIYGNSLNYYPGYGKVPLLAVQMLNTKKVAQDLNAPPISFTIPENDLTAFKLSEVLHWMKRRSPIEAHRFLVSVIRRIDGAGEYFAPQDSEAGFAVASHFDGILYYLLSGNFSRAVDAGIKYIKVSNVNIPTATISPAIVGRLDRARAAEPDPKKKPGVLAEFTENQGEKGGFYGVAKYQLPGEDVAREVPRIVDSYIPENGPFQNIVNEPDFVNKFPVFNANSLVISTEWLSDFFNLEDFENQNGKITPDRLEIDDYYLKLNEHLHKKITDLGDSNPGKQIESFLELKPQVNPSTQGKELTIQLARLLGSMVAVDPNHIALVVPRETDSGSRYDEYKKKDNYVVNARKGFWSQYVVPQLPPPLPDDIPLPETDTMVARLDALYEVAADSKNEPYMRAAWDFHTHLMNVLQVRDLEQVREFDGYIQSINSVPDIKTKIDLMQTYIGAKRAEFREAGYLAADEGALFQELVPGTFVPDASVLAVSRDLSEIYPDAVYARNALNPSAQAVTTEAPFAELERAALGQEFMDLFFKPQPGSVDAKKTFQINDQLPELPDLGNAQEVAGLKLILGFLHYNPNAVWALDIDGINEDQAKQFVGDLLRIAKEANVPIQSKQLRAWGSRTLGFDKRQISGPIARNFFVGFLAPNARLLNGIPIRDGVQFLRYLSDGRERKIMERLLAFRAMVAEAIDEKTYRMVGPASEFEKNQQLQQLLLTRIQNYLRTAVAA